MSTEFWVLGVLVRKGIPSVKIFNSEDVLLKGDLFTVLARSKNKDDLEAVPKVFGKRELKRQWRQGILVDYLDALDEVFFP